ncbi:MAG: hypothetical protein M1840_007572 [Geoglossum simile]|nr:MAG: hypothetical protein M1840_007572 [Geoglossum simile]
MAPAGDLQPTMNHPEDSYVNIDEEDDDEENAFFEEENANFEDTLGAFKSSNPDNNRWQRRFPRTSNKMSRFRNTVETVLVVHGWKTPAKTKPMTLVILSVSLNCHARNFRIQSVRMWFAFYEDDKVEPRNTEKAAPEVVAFAPFVEQETWNKSEEEIEETTSYSGNAGVEKVANVDGKKEVNRSYTRKHFDRGSADRLIDNDKVYGISWYCEQNDLQKYGVKPHFHIAVLLERSHTEADNKPISFSGVFDMRIEAGLLYDFESGIRRAFRLGRPEDEAIYYDPNAPDQMFGLEGEGARIKERVKKDNLGELMEKGHLSKLLDPEGTLSGLEPIAPKKA